MLLCKPFNKHFDKGLRRSDKLGQEWRKPKVSDNKNYLKKMILEQDLSDTWPWNP